MKHQFNSLDFIKKLSRLKTRQGESEAKAKRLIFSVLKKNKIDFAEQKFYTKIPITKKAVLYADKKNIACLGTSFVSGKVFGKDNIISSLISSEKIKFENINFNPKCPGISCSDYFFYPSVAVSKKDIPKILRAKKVEFEVIVEPLKFQSANILVGNIKNPKAVCFAHYDSIESGAIDNASGVAVMLDLILKNNDLLKENLFVFSGNEELSYDNPVYWGHGFRAFEKKYKNILEKAKKIVIIDGVGSSKTKLEQNDFLCHYAFPIKNVKNFQDKIILCYNDIDKLMDVYHSSLDLPKNINSKYLLEAKNMLNKFLQNI